MSISRKGGDRRGEPKLEASPESMTETDDGRVELAVRLSNPFDRALHYIADVRAMIFDPPARRLLVQLSDRGREVPPGGVMQPRCQQVDPQSEAVATIVLPRTIVKLSETPSPPGEILFEEYAVLDAEAIDLEIGWADTPYYPDPRQKQAAASPTYSWEQGATTVTFSTSDRRT